jgi:hypothetical protein
MKGRERMPVVLVGMLVIAVAVAIAGCGEDPVHYSDQKIIDKLNLEKSENGYSLGGDVFCEVKRQLLNDSDEVDDAADQDELGLVIASAEGNVGVEGVPVFSPNCKDEAKKKLNRLDPKPKE